MNANNSDYALEQHKSGRLTTINVGEDLQSLAARTLGDPDRFVEIAIANGLKAPYIDEIGETIPLISNGNSNLINIAKTDADGNLTLINSMSIRSCSYRQMWKLCQISELFRVLRSGRIW